MTGFGAGAASGAGVAVQAEVRSVNHRYLQVKVRLPGELAALEPDVEALVRKRLARGSVTVHVSVERTRAEALALDREVAERYRRDLARLAKELDLEQDVSLATLIALPGVLAPERRRGRADAVEKHVLAAVDAGLGELVGMREREGKALARDLARHVAALRKVTAQVEKRVPAVVRAARDGLRKRVEALLEDGGRVSAADLAREIALLADRYDVAEELARLASHLDQLEERIAAGSGDGGLGKRLDFLVQECMREVNTVGAKCNDARVAHWVVEGKTLVERLREQVQNVE